MKIQQFGQSIAVAALITVARSPAGSQTDDQHFHPKGKMPSEYSQKMFAAFSFTVGLMQADARGVETTGFSWSSYCKRTRVGTVGTEQTMSQMGDLVRPENFRMLTGRISSAANDRNHAYW
jgi:hypothetical protein